MKADLPEWRAATSARRQNMLLTDIFIQRAGTHPRGQRLLLRRFSGTPNKAMNRNASVQFLTTKTLTDENTVQGRTGTFFS